MRALFALLIAASGCAHLPANALAVPVVAQQTDYSCGPATLTATLRYWQRPVACEEELYPLLHTTPKDGTEPFMLEAVARAHGLRADYRVGATWEVASCDAGTSAPEACERALCDIVRRLQQHFDIAPT